MDINEILNKLVKLEKDEYLNLDTGRSNNKKTIERKKIIFVDKNLKVASSNEQLFREVVTELRDRSAKFINNTNKQTQTQTLTEFLIDKMIRLFITPVNTNTITTINTTPIPSSNNNDQVKQKDKEKDKEKEIDGIPNTRRYEVWQKYLGNVLIGKCFACHKELSSHKMWHCGHVVARKNGGSIEVANLRPVCGRCNHSMGTMHMWEYILLKDLPGKVNLPNDKTTKLYKSVVEAIKDVDEKLTVLKIAKIISAKEANEYFKGIKSRESTLSERITLIENINKIYLKYLRK